MKKALIERSLVVVLFILVLIVFAFAERDTRKLFERQTHNTVNTFDTDPAAPTASNTELPR